MANVTDQIKDKIDIVEFISSYVQLRKAGRNFVGFCPFHPNSRTPAFTVFTDTQSFHCFGCKASGTVFDFLMRREGLEFHAALEQLAQRAGVQLVERTEQDEQVDRLRTRLLDINAAATRFFHHVLVKSQRGEAARAYVEKRRIDKETVEAFQIGYSLDDWSALLSYLTDRKGFEPEEVEAAGLAIHRDNGGYHDRFRGRVMFPIRNAKGEVIAFGGRAMGDAQPKYLNSPQTPLFDKSRILYGIDLARDAIRASDSAVIVEGYVDVIIAHQYGFHNVVAPLGTALTSEHVTALKRIARRIYLALDADPAGIRAALKGVQTLQENPEGDVMAITGPQGIVGFQRKLDIEIKVIALPDGQDPDEVIQADPEQWRSLVASARPAMDFYITALTAGLDLQSARGKAEAVERIAPLLAQVTNPIEYAHYIQEIARLVQVDEQFILRAMPASGGRQKPPTRQKPTPAAQQRPATLIGPTTQPEDYMLAWLIHYPAVRTAVSEKIRRDLEPFPKVHELIDDTLLQLLQRIENRALWNAWLTQPEGTDPEIWAVTLDETLLNHLRKVLDLQLPEPQAYRYVNDALECATILQKNTARQWIDRLTHQQKDASDDETRLDALEQLVQVKAYLDAVSTPRRSSTYADLHTLHTV